MPMASPPANTAYYNKQKCRLFQNKLYVCIDCINKKEPSRKKKREPLTNEKVEEEEEDEKKEMKHR